MAAILSPVPFQAHFEIARLLLERSKLTLRAKHAPSTDYCYKSDWNVFASWSAKMSRDALPATSETLSLFLTDQVIIRGLKVSTAFRRTYAIADMHQQHGLPSPISEEIYALLRGAQRLKGEQPRRMRALSLVHLRAIVTLLKADGTCRSIRNRAILLLGFATALRRSNLATLLLADIEFTTDGLIVQVRREKNDQDAHGRLIGVSYGLHPETCPVRCLEDWLAIRGRQHGPLFCHRKTGRALRPPALGRMVQACVKRIGLDPTEYCGHSLRAGFITAAAEAGASELLISSTSGHSDMETLRRYYRRTEVFKGCAGRLLGL